MSTSTEEARMNTNTTAPRILPMHLVYLIENTQKSHLHPVLNFNNGGLLTKKNPNTKARIRSLYLVPIQINQAGIMCIPPHPLTLPFVLLFLVLLLLIQYQNTIERCILLESLPLVPLLLLLLLKESQNTIEIEKSPKAMACQNLEETKPLKAKFRLILVRRTWLEMAKLRKT